MSLLSAGFLHKHNLGLSLSQARVGLPWTLRASWPLSLIKTPQASLVEAESFPIFQLINALNLKALQ